MELELFLIRHGKTPGNEEKRYIGRTEESLSEKGREALLEKRYPEVTFLFSSPMKRCLESCSLLYPGMEPCVIRAFREIDFGRFEGKNYPELSGDPAYQAWIDSGGTLTFPEGESREAFLRRSAEGFKEMLRRILQSQRGGKAAAVVHGGTIMAILSRFYGGDYYDYQIPNGEGYALAVDLGEEGFRIREVRRC